MTHFAYPNVIPKLKAFIGCGRYKVSSRVSDPQDGYFRVDQTPNTPNRSDLEYALQLLSPTSFDSDKIILERQDDSRYPYQGNSLDLAYLLAHTHRAAALRKNLKGDVWCTGTIKVKDGIVYLHKVDEKGFQIKLSQFLSTDNSDTLFIVPAANMQSKSLETATSSGAQIWSITQMHNNKNAFAAGSKVIFKILPGELPELIDWLFNFKQAGSNRTKVITGSLLAVFFVSVFSWRLYFQPDSVEPGEIMQLLEDGDLTAATASLQRYKNNPQIATLWNSLHTSPEMKVFFDLQRNGDGSLLSQPFHSYDNTDLTLSDKDDYRLRISAESPAPNSYLYVFQIDAVGKASWIYPNISWKMENPIDAGSWPVSIPAEEDQWLFLDELDAELNNGIKETLHVLVTPWRATDIEAMLNKIISETDRSERIQRISRLESQLEKGQKSMIRSLEYHSMTFLHK